MAVSSSAVVGFLNPSVSALSSTDLFSFPHFQSLLAVESRSRFNVNNQTHHRWQSVIRTHWPTTSERFLSPICSPAIEYRYLFPFLSSPSARSTLQKQMHHSVLSLTHLSPLKLERHLHCIHLPRTPAILALQPQPPYISTSFRHSFFGTISSLFTSLKPTNSQSPTKSCGR